MSDLPLDLGMNPATATRLGESGSRRSYERYRSTTTSNPSELLQAMADVVEERGIGLLQERGADVLESGVELTPRSDCFCASMKSFFARRAEGSSVAPAACATASRISRNPT